MQASPRSLALLMVLLGIMLIYFSRQSGAVPAPTYIAAGALCGAGAFLFSQRPIAYWVALGAGLLTFSLAILSALLRRDLVPTPIITGVMGLLVTMRVLLARTFERRLRERMAARAAERKQEEGEGEQPSS